MPKTKKADSVLVYDRYYSHKPNAAVSVLKKTAYCCTECLCMLFCLLNIYNIETNPWIIGILCAFFTALFGLLFCFVKKRFAVPSFLLIFGFLIWKNKETVWEKFSYCVDKILLALDGDVFGLSQYLWHKNNYNAEGEILFSVILISAILALICAGAMFKKPSGVLPPIVFAALILPVLISQNLKLNFWFIPAVALLFGGIAFAKPFSSGIISRGGIYSGCRKNFMQEERAFGVKAAKAPIIKRYKMNAVHYSKYFSVGVTAVVIFTAAGLFSTSIMGSGAGIDYSGFFEFFENLGYNVGFHPPFEEFSNDYFSDGSDELGYSLGITNPVKGNQRILTVTNTGEKVYLRGDIGIDFNGTMWSSPVTMPNRKPSSYFRPAEMNVLSRLEENLRENRPNVYYDLIPEEYLKDGRVPFISKGDITINYQCNTNIVFLPAYTSEYPYYDNSDFRIYGDYVVRTKQDKITSVNCTALVPYANYTGKDSELKQGMVYAADIVNNTHNFADWFGIFIASNKYEYPEYRQYVYETYTVIDQNMWTDIQEFLYSNNLIEDNPVNSSNFEKYKYCVKIADYLENNYTYSLNADNGTENPVMEFLNNTKSGHCALYASAMTLIMRSKGYPARYCTGFIAPHTEPGKSAVIKSKDLHAWCEVYFDNIGWITFDPTSAAVSSGEDIDYSSSKEESSYESSEISESSEESENSEEESSEDIINNSGDSEDNSVIFPENSSNNYEPPDENKEINIVIVIVIALIVFVIAAFAIFLIYKFRTFDKKTRKALEFAKTYGDCEELYAKIIAILELCGYTQKTGEQPKSFFTRVDRHFKTKLSKSNKLFMKIAFGNGKFSAEEIKETALHLQSLFEAADTQLVAFGRVKLRRIILGKKP